MVWRQTLKSSEDGIRRGLVLSGGAALGAYQAGVLKAIREHGISFQAIAATSVGTIHALAWNRGDTILSIDQHWKENVASMRPFRPKHLLRLKSPFRFRASIDELFEGYRSGYLDQSSADKIPIMVSLTEASTGSNRLFSLSTPDLSGQDREKICKASAVIPLVGDRPIKIQGLRYYDGGFSNNIPVDYLESLDLDEIWVVILAPYKRRRLWKRSVIFAADSIYNRSRHPWVRSLSGLTGQLLRAHDHIVSPKKTFVIRPSTRDSLGAYPIYQALTFSRRNIETLLDMGYRDGIRGCREYLLK